MMSDQYQQTFTTTDAQNNVTYIQFIPHSSNVLYCKEEIANEEDYIEHYEEDQEEGETIEESYIEEDPMSETIEVLESVVVERKKSKRDPESFVTKKLVQKNVKGKNEPASE